VIAVLVLGVGGWLFYPRTDPRFVGEWEFFEGDDTTSVLRVDLNRWGRARLYEPGYSILTSWSVSDGEFRIGHEPVGFMKQAMEVLEEQLSGLTGNNFQLSSSDSLVIAEVTPDEIHLEDDTPIARVEGRPSTERERYRLVRRKK